MPCQDQHNGQCDGNDGKICSESRGPDRWTLTTSCRREGENRQTAMSYAATVRISHYATFFSVYRKYQQTSHALVINQTVSLRMVVLQEQKF